MSHLISLIFFIFWMMPAFSNVHFQSKTYGGSFQQKDFKDQAYQNLIFRNVNFTRSKFSGSTFFNVQFIDCDLSGVSFHHTRMTHVKFLRTRGPRISFWDAKLKDVAFESVHFPFMDMSLVELNKVTFENSKISHSNMSYSHLFDVSINTSEIFQIVMLGATAWNVVINGKPLEEPPYSYVSPPFIFKTSGVFNVWQLGLARDQKPVELMTQHKDTGVRIIGAVEPSAECLDEYPSIDLLGKKGNMIFSMFDGRDNHPCYSLCSKKLRLKLRFNLQKYPAKIRSKLIVWINLDDEYTQLGTSPVMKRLGKELSFNPPLSGDVDVEFASNKNIAVCEIRIKEGLNE